MDDAHPTELKRLKSVLSTLRTNCKTKFEAACRIQEKFEKNASLQDSEFIVSNIKVTNVSQQYFFPRPGFPPLT